MSSRTRGGKSLRAGSGLLPYSKKRKTRNATRKVLEFEYDPEDRISRLPEDILILILSLLTMKEAGKTSILSRRWEKLWTSIPNLIFEGFDKVFSLRNHYDQKYVALERKKYLNWVDSVFRSYDGLDIHQIKIQFPFPDAFNRDIRRWINFALQQKVKDFELDLSNGLGECFWFSCSFPALHWRPSYFPIFDSLTSLVLKSVDVSGKVIEFLLQNCTFLESLYMSGSRSLGHLIVAGQICLKHLAIVKSNLESLELSSPTLLSFKYYGWDFSHFLQDVPNVVDLHYGGTEYSPTNYYPVLLSFASQVQKLTLRIAHLSTWISNGQIPILSHLQHLKLCPDVVKAGESLLIFLPLINGSPALHKLTLKCRRIEVNTKPRKSVIFPLRSHSSLRLVEIIGFQGEIVDMEFCEFLILTAIALEKIVIDIRNPEFVKARKEQQRDQLELSRKRANRLREKYSLGDKLVIL